MTFRTWKENGSIDIRRQRDPDKKATLRPTDLTPRGKMLGEGVEQCVPPQPVGVTQLAHSGVEVSQPAELGSDHCAKMIHASAAVAKAALNQPLDHFSASGNPADAH